jgi:uncharacterized protein
MFDWLPVSESALLIGLLVTTVAATLQSTIGFGFAILSVPVLSLVDPRLAPVPQLLLIVPLTTAMLIREWSSIDLRGIGWVILGRCIGAGLGVALLMVADQFILDLSIAAIVFSAVIALTFVKTVPRNRITETIAGTVSGVGALVSSIGGPPLALLYRDANGSTLRSSLAAIFAIGLFITIGARLSGGLIGLEDLIIAFCLVPAIGLGLFFSKLLIGRVEGAPLRRGIIVVASLAAVGLTIRALIR